MGTLSADADPKVQDLTAIMEGGQNFVARVTAFQNLKQASEEAVKRARIVGDIERARAEANAAREQAYKVLADAEERATQMDEKAKRQAHDMVQAIESQQREAGNLVNRTLANANFESERLINEARATKAEATASRDEAAHLQAEAKRLKAELEQHIAAATQREQDAETLKTQLRDKLSLLRNALAQAKE
jgi:hypothetical protein